VSRWWRFHDRREGPPVDLGVKVDTHGEVVETPRNSPWSWLDRWWRKGLASTIAVPRKKAPVENHTIASAFAAALSTWTLDKKL
jgi:hypothetical protein